MCSARTVLLCIVGLMFPFGAAACLCVRFFRGQAVIRIPQQPVALKRRLHTLYLGERRRCCRCPLNRHLLSYRLPLSSAILDALSQSLLAAPQQQSGFSGPPPHHRHQDTAGRCSVEPGVLQSLRFAGRAGARVLSLSLSLSLSPLSVCVGDGRFHLCLPGSPNAPQVCSLTSAPRVSSACLGPGEAA